MRLETETSRSRAHPQWRRVHMGQSGHGPTLNCLRSGHVGQWPDLARPGRGLVNYIFNVRCPIVKVEVEWLKLTYAKIQQVTAAACR
jgi:hypothetical protein